jgi:hypothetical protein
MGGLTSVFNAADPFVMQYADGFPLDQVAWGDPRWINSPCSLFYPTDPSLNFILHNPWVIDMAGAPRCGYVPQGFGSPT